MILVECVIIVLKNTQSTCTFFAFAASPLIEDIIFNFDIIIQHWMIMFLYVL